MPRKINTTEMRDAALAIIQRFPGLERERLAVKLGYSPWIKRGRKRAGQSSGFNSTIASLIKYMQEAEDIWIAPPDALHDSYRLYPFGYQPPQKKLFQPARSAARGACRIIKPAQTTHNTVMPITSKEEKLKKFEDACRAARDADRVPAASALSREIGEHSNWVHCTQGAKEIYQRYFSIPGEEDSEEEGAQQEIARLRAENEALKVQLTRLRTLLDLLKKLDLLKDQEAVQAQKVDRLAQDLAAASAELDAIRQLISTQSGN